MAPTTGSRSSTRTGGCSPSGSAPTGATADPEARAAARSSRRTARPGRRRRWPWPGLVSRSVEHRGQAGSARRRLSPPRPERPETAPTPQAESPRPVWRPAWIPKLRRLSRSSSHSFARRACDANARRFFFGCFAAACQKDRALLRSRLVTRPQSRRPSGFFVWHEFCHLRAGCIGEVTAQSLRIFDSGEGSMDTWRARLVVLACVFTVLTFAGPAIAGERLVFDAFLGAQLTPTGVDPNRDYFFAAGMAVDSRGAVYVADPVNDSVLTYDGLGVGRVTRVCCYTAYGDGFLATNVSVAMKFPMSVAVDPRNDDVWITSTLTGRVIKMDKNQRLLNVVGWPGTGPGEFETPIRIAVDPRGNLYVLDDGGRTCDVRSCSTSDANVRIQKFRADGTFVRAWGSFCEFSSASVGPCNASAAGAIVTGDGQFGFTNFLAVATDPRSQPQRGFQVSLVGMAVDSFGNVYVADQGRVQKFNTNGVLLLKFATAASVADVAVDFADNVYVTEFENDRIRKFDCTGRFL